MARSEPRVLAVGRITRPHGLHGDVRVEVETDFPERVLPGMEVGAGREGPERTLVVHRVRWHKGAWLMAFEGFLTCDDVATLRDWWLFLPEQERSELPATYFYEHELIGCACVSADGSQLGTVAALLPGGAGSLLEVSTAAGAVLVPFVSPIVIRVDAGLRRIVLDPPRGLFDDHDAL